MLVAHLEYVKCLILQTTFPSAVTSRVHTGAIVSLSSYGRASETEQMRMRDSRLCLTDMTVRSVHNYRSNR
jgi:hypothetical protein